MISMTNRRWLRSFVGTVVTASMLLSGVSSTIPAAATESVPTGVIHKDFPTPIDAADLKPVCNAFGHRSVYCGGLGTSVLNRWKSKALDEATQIFTKMGVKSYDEGTDEVASHVVSLDNGVSGVIVLLRVVSTDPDLVATTMYSSVAIGFATKGDGHTAPGPDDSTTTYSGFNGMLVRVLADRVSFELTDFLYRPATVTFDAVTTTVKAPPSYFGPTVGKCFAVGATGVFAGQMYNVLQTYADLTGKAKFLTWFVGLSVAIFAAWVIEFAGIVYCLTLTAVTAAAAYGGR